jgi:DNA helicase HerA-like ATPase
VGASDNRLATASEQPRLPSEDMLVGLSGYRIPLAFIIHSDANGVSIQFGAWSQQERENAPPAVLNSRQQIVGAILQSLYPNLDMEPASDVQVPHFEQGGLVLGMPSIKTPDPHDGALPLDRLLRALPGSNWMALVLAEPVSAKAISDLRANLLNEIRSVTTAADTTHIPSPLSKYYSDLLEIAMMSFSRGQAVGMWRTAVYLLGDTNNYYRLASVWQSIYSGEASLPEPVRVIDNGLIVELAKAWAMPDQPCSRAPGLFQHPFACQTLITSSQLAAYIHLPAIETSGFSIRLVPDYDIVPRPAPSGTTLRLGPVMDHSRQTGTQYLLSTADLNRHALVAGVTGSGKTNTLFYLLIQLWKQHIPFLVLEPAKTEYRSLLTEPSIGGDVRVFTLGDEKVSPLRINPFEVEAGISIATHIDLLKSVFNASFGLWNPLPQVLERCIHAIYRDYGWDPVRNINRRLDGYASEEAFPIITDLYNKVEEVVNSLGYDEKVASDIKAALLTRLNSLRIGGKGVLLDTQHPIPITELINYPTIIELEPIGDDDEKAFLMGLLLIRLYEHLRATGSTEGKILQHVVVVEEAHRLLANVPPQTNQEQSNVRGKAVETFANMLSEIRAYGEGFLVAEQIPSKLAMDVIKNTNMKIVHRLVAGDDREVLGKTMNMGEQQRDMLSTLQVGQAAVFAEGDDRPVLVAIPYAKLKVPPEMLTKTGSDQAVGRHMTGFRRQTSIANRFVPFPACPQACGEPYRYCEEARQLVVQRDFQNLYVALILSLVVPGGIVLSPARNLVEYIAARLPQWNSSSAAIACISMNAARWYFAHFGGLYNWSYAIVEQLRAQAISVLLNMLPPLAQPGERLKDFSREQADFALLYHSACRRSSDPFPACAVACPNQQCLFRFQTELLLADRHLTEIFEEGMAEAVQGSWDDMSAIDQAISRLVGYQATNEIQRSVGLCFGIQQVTFRPGMLEGARHMAIERLIDGVDRHLTESRSTA